MLVVPGRGNHDSQFGLPLDNRNLYNARATGDQCEVIEHVHKTYPDAPVYAIGFSLGANILVNLLADHPGIVDGAVVVSCPWDLRRSSKYVLENSWLYSYAFGRALGNFATRNRDALLALYRQRTGDDAPLRAFLSRRATSVLEFDKAITSRVAGYNDADHYYEDASCHLRVSRISVPTLAISARDDPCVDSTGMPMGSGSEWCTFVMSECGGHLGFLRDGWNWRGTSWCDELAVQWIGALIKARQRK